VTVTRSAASEALRVQIAQSIHRIQPTLPSWQHCLERADQVIEDLAVSGYEITKSGDVILSTLPPEWAPEGTTP